MGQENEIKDSQTFLNDLASHEEKLKKENISSYSFEKAKRIAESYLAYERVLHKKGIKFEDYQISINEYSETNKSDKIKKEFELLKEWTKIVITPYKSNQKSNEIVDKDQKVGNNNESINFANYTDKALEKN